MEIRLSTSVKRVRAHQVFITYNKSENKPAKPTNNGESNGWSSSNEDGAIWMSQKSALKVDKGVWGDVIRIKGETGTRGRMNYPAGVWDASASYTCTSLKTPYVFYEAGKTFYVLNKEGTFKALNPAEDYAQNGNNATWIPFENFQAIFANILMAQYALLGPAVFYDDYMLSQEGAGESGNVSTNFEEFNTGGFNPNIMLNFKTGLASFRKLEVGNKDDSAGLYISGSTFRRSGVGGDFELSTKRRNIGPGSTTVLEYYMSVIADLPEGNFRLSKGTLYQDADGFVRIIK